MRDIIWTLIIVWLISRIVSIFRQQPKKTIVNPGSSENSQTGHPIKKVSKEALNRHLSKEGEYVDFEEVK